MNEGLFALRVSGPYTWRGLYSEFYGMSRFIQQGAQKCDLLYFYADINQSESRRVSSWLLIGLNLYQRSEQIKSDHTVGLPAVKVMLLFFYLETTPLLLPLAFYFLSLEFIVFYGKPITKVIFACLLLGP